MKKLILVSLVFGLLNFSTYVQSNELVEEPDDYKLDNYRSATPETLSGATVVGALVAKELYDNGEVIFIDVLPSPKRPEALPESEIWLPKKRLNIPGSVWLADVGFGVLSDELNHYFTSNLEQLNKLNKKGMLFYCKANCWMSWNAAKRAINFGYSNVFWFPGGTDDWSSQDYVLEESKPKES